MIKKSFCLSFLLISLSIQAQVIDPAEFKDPALRYAPAVRWWWPGNDVETTELQRELQLFADNHIGGVEIQAFALVVPQPRDRGRQIMSFDTDSYYGHLRTVMDEAKRLGMTVDLTNGSGWPASGDFITEAEENRSLQYGMADVPDAGGAVAIPRSKRQDSKDATLIGLLLAQVRNPAEGGPLPIKDVQVLPVPAGNQAACPAGKTDAGWNRKLIALWSVPSQENNQIIAKMGAGKVLDHFDTKVLRKTYDHYFGSRTGLEAYYGKPFRSFFNDSYEFKVDRHVSADFAEVFRARHGYDPLPWMPANIWYGYNNMYDPGKPAPEFTFGDEDWRLRYDYDLTVSDLVRKHLLKGSSEWAHAHGLQHKTQAYGLPMDYMGAAGDADIPETENMIFDGGSEGGLKMVSSGAMLYNRPLVTCESGVHVKRALMATPQKLRITVDKVLASGVNQIIWHGSPYHYEVNGTPWQPFYNPMLGINFSSDLYEANVFWEEYSQVNAYAQRAQYLMQQGKATADVLVYYPFLEYSKSVRNPEEILHFGHLPQTEPPLESAAPEDNAQSRWLEAVWPVLNALERQGITWAWVNDESLREMTADKAGNLHIRGNGYKGLVLFDPPYIQLETAQNLRKQKDANLLILGNLPTKQPSFRDYAKNDRKTASLMKKVASGKRVCRDAENWWQYLDLPVRIRRGGDRVRLCRRDLGEGRILEMFWNVDATPASLLVSADAPYAYWLDAETGDIVPVPRIAEGRQIMGDIPPRSTRFLYLTDHPIESEALDITITRGETAVSLDDWTIRSGETVIDKAPLRDWRNIPALENSAAEGVYTTTFELAAKDGRYRLDLGQVCYTAEVTVNGKRVGKRIWQPYEFDVTDFVRAGTNTVEVRVKVSDYNARVKEGGRLANGLIGPARLVVQP